MPDHAISRRHLLAASGGGSAALVLSACGAAATGDPEETEPEREAELLNGLITAQLTVQEIAQLAFGNSPEDLQQALVDLNQLRTRTVEDLFAAVDELGGPGAADESMEDTAESPTEALGLALDNSITVALDAIAEITTDAYRQLVHRGITEDAAFRAAIADTLGEELASESFVGVEVAAE